MIALALALPAWIVPIAALSAAVTVYWAPSRRRAHKGQARSQTVAAQSSLRS